MKPFFTIQEFKKDGTPKKRKTVHGTCYTAAEIKEIKRQLGENAIIPIDKSRNGSN